MGRQLSDPASSGLTMPLTRFGDVPAVHDLPELSSIGMSRSPSISSTCSSSSLPSPIEPAPSSKSERQSAYAHYESAYRGFQRENHDLRKLLNQLRQKLAITQHRLEDEESKQELLHQTIGDLQASLDEVRARSLDVLEENLSLRADNQNLRPAQAAKLPARPNSTKTHHHPLLPTKPDGDISPLALNALPVSSPLDRQLAALHPDILPKPSPQRQQPRHQRRSSSTDDLASRHNATCPPSDSFLRFLDTSGPTPTSDCHWSLQSHAHSTSQLHRRGATPPTSDGEESDQDDDDDDNSSTSTLHLAFVRDASRRARQGSSDTVRGVSCPTSRPSRTPAMTQQPMTQH